MPQTPVTQQPHPLLDPLPHDPRTPQPPVRDTRHRAQQSIPHPIQRMLGTLRRSASALTGSLASAIFPAPCTLCDTPLAHLSAAPICRACWASLSPQGGTLCLQCGEALGAHAFATDDRAPGDWLCRPCRIVPPAFDRALAVSLYASTMRTLLHLLKYQAMPPIAGPLGHRMASLLAAQPAVPRTFTVVPVPLYRGKQRQRGFNQAELLARSVARHLRGHGFTTTLAPQHLIRRRATDSQASLSPSARRRNLQGAFTVPGSEQSKPLAGLSILLIDDIYTTGATARAASSALRRAGAQEVWVLTAARAQRHEFVEPLHPMETPMAQDVAFWASPPPPATLHPGLTPHSPASRPQQSSPRH